MLKKGLATLDCLEDGNPGRFDWVYWRSLVSAFPASNFKLWWRQHSCLFFSSGEPWYFMKPVGREKNPTKLCCTVDLWLGEVGSFQRKVYYVPPKLAVTSDCPTGLLNSQTHNKFTRKKIVPFLWHFNDMFHYMFFFKAEFVTLVSLKVPSGCFLPPPPLPQVNQANNGLANIG